MILSFLLNNSTVIWTLIAIFLVLVLSLHFFIMRTRARDAADMKELSTLRFERALILPELKSAIDLLYSGKVKDARNKLCRIRNTIAPIED
jgi:hypothetical protein